MYCMSTSAIACACLATPATALPGRLGNSGQQQVLTVHVQCLFQQLLPIANVVARVSQMGRIAATAGR